MEQQKIKILLADDHHVVRFGLCSLLEKVDNLKVVADTGSGKDCINLYKKHRPDVAVLDITMPDLSGIEATKYIKEVDPEAKILLISYHISEDILKDAMFAGAIGYILKDSNKEDLIEAIHTVASGKRYFSKEVSNLMVEDYASRLQPLSESEHEIKKLTNREKQVLVLIVEGLTSQEIGAKLFISPRTVDTHRNNLIHKLKVKNSAALVKYAIEKGLV